MPVLFPLWAQAISQFVVRSEYKTDIITSRKGREQRRAGRQTPRKVIEFSATMLPPTWRKVRNALANGQRFQWYCSDPSRAMTTNVDASGTGPFTVNTVPDWAAVGLPVAVQHGSNYELRTIDAIAGNNLTLSAGTVADWPSGTSIYLALLGYLSAQLQQQTIIRDALTAKITFEVDPVSEPDDPISSASATVADGRELWEQEPLRLAPIETTLEVYREIVDAGQGIVQRFHPIDYTGRMFRATFTSIDKTFQEYLQDWQRRQKGCRGEFFMPTFEPDLVANTDTTASGSNTIVVDDPNDLVLAFNNSPIYRFVYVKHLDGTTQINELVSVTGTGPYTFIFVDNWTADIVYVDDRVSWLPMWRFASDAVEFTYIAAREAADSPFMTAMVNLIALEYQVAESAISP